MTKTEAVRLARIGKCAYDFMCITKVIKPSEHSYDLKSIKETMIFMTYLFSWTIDEKGEKLITPQGHSVNQVVEQIKKAYETRKKEIDCE